MSFNALFKIFSLNKPIIFCSYVGSQRYGYLTTTVRSSHFKSFIFYRRNCKLYMYNKRCMAGHAKWQNVKFVKTEKDRQKSVACSKYIRLVIAAVRENGPDPKLNSRLASVLEEAKKNNVPMSSLESAFKKSSNKKVKPGTVEITGPGALHIVVDFETDNMCDFRHTVKVICKKYGGNLLNEKVTKWRASFDQKGIIKISNEQNGNSLNNEAMLDAAIEAGAEDVQKREDESGLYYEFLSSPDDLHSVKKELERKYQIEEAYIGYLPINTLQLDGNDMVIVDKFLSELSDLPDIVRLFENVE